MTLITLTMFSFVMTQKQVEQAHAYQNDVKSKLQLSDGKAEVKVTLPDQAEANGYLLTITGCEGGYETKLTYTYPLGVLGLQPKDHLVHYLKKK